MEMAPHHARGTFTDVRYIQLPITNHVRTNYVVLKINEHQNKMTYREASYFNPAHTSETLINVIFLCPSVCLPVHFLPVGRVQPHLFARVDRA